MRHGGGGVQTLARVLCVIFSYVFINISVPRTDVSASHVSHDVKCRLDCTSILLGINSTYTLTYSVLRIIHYRILRAELLLPS